LGFLLSLDMFYPVIQPATVVGLHLDWEPLAPLEQLVLQVQQDLREQLASVLQVLLAPQVQLVLLVLLDPQDLMVQQVPQVQLES
jgi:hypothetical protein